MLVCYVGLFLARGEYCFFFFLHVHCLSLHALTYMNARQLELKKNITVWRRLIYKNLADISAWHPTHVFVFFALASHVTKSILTFSKRRTCLMTVWRLSSTVSKYLSHHSNRATWYSCPVGQQHRWEEQCYSAVPVWNGRNWSRAHFLSHFLMGLLSGWLVGGTTWRGKERWT